MKEISKDEIRTSKHEQFFLLPPTTNQDVNKLTRERKKIIGQIKPYWCDDTNTTEKNMKNRKEEESLKPEQQVTNKQGSKCRYKQANNHQRRK